MNATCGGTDIDAQFKVEENIGLVRAIAKCHGSGDFEFARNPEEQKMLWSARKEALWSMLALREKGSDVWSTDVAVPLSRLSDIIGELLMCLGSLLKLTPRRNIQERDG